MISPVRLIDKTVCINLGGWFHNTKQLIWTICILSGVWQVSVSPWGYYSRTVGGMRKEQATCWWWGSTAQPYNISQLVPALQEKAETDRGNAGSCQLCGLAQSRNQSDCVSSSSQQVPGASLSTLAWIPTSGYKTKTAAPRALLNFHFYYKLDPGRGREILRNYVSI